MHTTIVCMLESRQQVVPIILLVVDIVSDHLLQSSICSLCLFICLRVMTCRHCQPRLRESEEFFPELTNKTSIPIGYYFLWQPKPPIPVVEEHLRSCHCVHIGSGRDEHHQLGEFIHNYYHRVMNRFGLGQGGVKSPYSPVRNVRSEFLAA